MEVVGSHFEALINLRGKFRLEARRMQNPRCHGAARRPFSHSYLLSLLSPRPPVRPVPLFAKTNDDDGAHLLSLSPSRCRNESRRRLLASPHLSLPSSRVPSFLPLFDHSQYRHSRRRLRRSSSVTRSQLGLTHFHRNAVFASSTTTIHNTTRGGARIDSERLILDASYG